MPGTIQATVRFYGFQGLPDSPEAISLPVNVTLRGLLRCLAERYGDAFSQRAIPEGEGLPARVRVFVNNEPLEEPEAKLADRLGPNPEIAIVVLTPMMGG